MKPPRLTRREQQLLELGAELVAQKVLAGLRGTLGVLPTGEARPAQESGCANEGSECLDPTQTEGDGESQLWDLMAAETVATLRSSAQQRGSQEQPGGHRRRRRSRP